MTFDSQRGAAYSVSNATLDEWQVLNNSGEEGTSFSSIPSERWLWMTPWPISSTGTL